MAPASSTATAETTRVRGLVLLILLVLFVSAALYFRDFTCDDSYITFRYAQNAVHGLGLVFNPGERVEGYSNPLWLALLVLAGKLGLDIVLAAKCLGLLAGLGALLFAYGIVRRLSGSGEPSHHLEGQLSRNSEALTPLVALLLVTPGLACYSVSGLETPLYCCLLTGAVYCLLLTSAAAQWALAGLALAAALTRPEGLLVMAALLGLRLLAWRRWDSATWESTLAALIGFGLFLHWRHSYFGSWLPNTYYAKPPGAFGGGSLLAPLGYLREFLANTGAWVWLALGLIWLRRRPLAAVGMLLVVAVEVALVVHARGDWMAMSRFLLPALPLLVAFGYAALLRLVPARLVVGAVVAVTVLLNGVQIAQEYSSFRNGEYPEAVMAGQPQQEAGQWLRQHYPPQTTLACKRIGGISYYSGMRMTDMLGLVDRRLALIRHHSRARGDAEYAALAEEILSRRPDLVLLCVMKRWDKVPLTQPAPDIVSNLRDVDNAVYARLGKYGYRFVQRLPQGGTGELAVYARDTRTGRL